MDATSHSERLCVQSCIHCSARERQENLSREYFLWATKEKSGWLCWQVTPSPGSYGSYRCAAPSQPTLTPSEGGTRYQFPRAIPAPRPAGRVVVIPKFSWLGHVVSASRGSEGGRRLECLINILSRSRVIELSGDGLVLNQIFQLRLLKSFSYKYPRCISRPRGGSLHSHNLICGSGSSAKKCI